jgi:hypothetical protein
MVNGKENVQEAAADVSPGRTTVVDFTRPPSEQLPSPVPQPPQPAPK